MKEIQTTGLNFYSGQTLRTSDLNKINDTLNEVVEAINIINRGLFDVNQELGQYKTMSLQDAIRCATRRSLGMKIRFLSFENKYLEYSFVGEAVDDSSWFNLENWSTGGAEIDGGIW